MSKHPSSIRTVGEMSISQPVSDRSLTPERLAALNTIQQRVLWLATLMIHHANHGRPNPDGIKIGGHQASSASMASILTALYFHFLKPGDRVAIKPHASPAFHAVQYLLGRLPERYLTTLRSYGGLQAYPSRTKDPDAVDFSTGSVGLGAVAPAFAALTHQYARLHFGSVTSGRFIAVIGDAELDEGNVWEAVLDPALGGLENLIWVVDLNRQSLDRVVPGIRAAQLKRLFEDSGWQVLEAKYGRRLQELFTQPGGTAFRQRIDEMSNEEYQALIRLPGEQLRPRLLESKSVDHAALAAIVDAIPDAELPSILANLGGHDLEELLSVLAQVDDEPDRPSIIFAYTIKGWQLPIAGHPLNHSMLLSVEQFDELRERMGIVRGEEWRRFDPASAEGQLCAASAERVFSSDGIAPAHLSDTIVPTDLAVPDQGEVSTQETFGRLLVRLADVPELRERIVTTSPDVSVSTNLAGWINKVGVFARQDEPDYETETYRLMKWQRGPDGRHIELGISEMNLFMLLGMLGLSAELCGQPLIPIGTVYDPFICRGLDALIYGLYSESKFIIAGTPSGITLSPEGGAHQSSVTPSLGVELPNLCAYEPGFAQETAWIMLEALRQCIDRNHGRATYVRLSTRPVDQSLLANARRRLGDDALRRQVLAGGYRLVDWRESGLPAGAPVVQIVTSGVMVPEAVAAARFLHREGVAAHVLNLSSMRRLFETWQAMRRQKRNDVFTEQTAMLDWLIEPTERYAPIITVHDAAPHAMAWLGSVYGAPVTTLGVDGFGQSGQRTDLYRHFGIDTEQIVEAAFAAVDQL